jgi:DNA-binding transcriptional LysR family regulator
MDRLRTLEAFVRVAETRSFSETARRLRSSKSAISRQVAALEAELGARLFHRTTRRLEDSSLVARKLAPIRRAICASPIYLQARGIPDSPDDLKSHECLSYSNVAAASEWRFAAPDGRPWPVEVKGRLSTNNGDALVAAALRGLGLINQPTFLVGRHLQAGTLRSVLDRFVPQDLTVSAVYPHARHLSPKVRAFVDFLAERFGPRPYWDDPATAGQGE